MFRKKKRKFRPSYVSGINFKLAGRIDSKSLKSRAKSKLYHRGSLARGKANIVTFSRFTHKNKRGTFSITVSVGQGFFQNREKQVVLVNHVDEVITNYNIINYEPEYDYSLNDFDKTPKQ